MKTPPCYKCQNHTAECHAACDDYASWQAAHKAAKLEDERRNAANVVIIENCVRIRDKKLIMRKKKGI